MGMTEKERARILLTNDDGIRSPGLWAAAEALSTLGFVTVAAPREQQSGSGRSMPLHSDGVIHMEEVVVGGKRWKVYAIGGSPAQTVQYAVLELMPEPPDLVVSGINYGENVGIGVTISGTVGAALEGAVIGVPSMAVSLETELGHHLSHSEDVQFTAAAYFTQYFARKLLRGKRLQDVDVLKIDIPCDATPETAWKVTRVAKYQYFLPVKPDRESLEEPVRLNYHYNKRIDCPQEGTDAYVLSVERAVAVTPLSLDLTSRVDLSELEKMLGS
jgi:5'-nucleotidase